jgi:serine/threonine protein kinase
MAKIFSAGDFATSGERRVAEELEKLPDSWIVICNKTLVANNGRSFEIDFIVIADQWVFLLDEKSWQGRIRGNDMHWVRQDGSSESSPLRKIDYLAKVMAGHLRYHAPMLNKAESHFVRGGIVFSALTQTPSIIDRLAKEHLFVLTELCEHLIKLDQQGGSVLIKQNRFVLQNCLYNLTNRSKVAPRLVNDRYQVEESLDLRPGVRLWRAKFIDSDERRNLMVYDLGSDPLHREELRQFYLREFKALNALQATGLVPDMSDHFTWSEDFLVLPLKPLRGKALSAYIAPRTRDELVKELQVAAEVFRGLVTIHQQEVVHRALSPDAIHVVHENQKTSISFANFYAARISASDRSIATPLDALTIDDPYAAPEIAYGYEFARPASDVFSVGMIFLERWSQAPMSELRRAPDKPAHIPDLQSHWSSLPAPVIEGLVNCLRAICGTERDNERPQAAEIAHVLIDLAKRLKIEVSIEEGKRLDNRYTVIRVLGQGSTARTYLAIDEMTDERFALKQFLNPSSSAAEQAKNEFKTLWKLHHENLPPIYDVSPLTNDVHVKMGYIPGPTLQDVEQDLPWKTATWWSFARGLLSAVEELERNGILHRDIKPANIILHEADQHPVLIDFGFAIPANTEQSVAGTPLYLPPEAFTSSKPPLSSDRYATALVLFKTLTGQLPFDEQGKGGTRTLSIPSTVTHTTQRKLAEVLLKALAPNPEERFASAQELRERLQNVVLASPIPVPPLKENTLQQPLINPWINKLRSLYRNSQLGNENNRGLDDDFVLSTYVETKLDRDLLPLLLEAKPRVVFLSGNPGDGKTAFLEQVRNHLQKHGGKELSADKSGWEWSYQGHAFRSCYDASESNRGQGQSADEQLSQKLAGLEGDQQPELALTVLVAINDGRLLDFFDNYQQRFTWLAQQLHQQKQDKQKTDQLVWLIDLKKRAFITLPESKDLALFQDLLLVLLDIDNWQVCQECSAKEVCPIRQNVKKLNKSNITHRLERLFLLTHLRRLQHITMRDLRSAIAYIATGDLGCNDVHRMLKNGSDLASLTKYDYWQLVFGDHGIASQDPILADFVMLDPGLFAHPRLDRFLHFHQEDEYGAKRSQLFQDKQDLSRRRFSDEYEWIVAFKRRMYFEMADKVGHQVGLPKMRREELLPYQHADTFFSALNGQIDLEALKEQLALGLLYSSEGVVGIATKGLLSVVVEVAEENQLVVLKQFPLQEFRLHVERPQSSDLVESIPEVLVLEYYKHGNSRLEVTLDLFEFMMRLASGLQAGAQEYVPLLEDLKVFKSALLLQETRNLVLIENKQKIHYITQHNGKIVRSDVPLH